MMGEWTNDDARSNAIDVDIAFLNGTFARVRRVRRQPSGRGRLEDGNGAGTSDGNGDGNSNANANANANANDDVASVLDRAVMRARASVRTRRDHAFFALSSRDGIVSDEFARTVDACAKAMTEEGGEATARVGYAREIGMECAARGIEVREKARERDLLDFANGASEDGARDGATVVSVESESDGGVALREATKRASAVFAEGGVSGRVRDHHLIFTLRLKSRERREGDRDGGDGGDETVARLHFVFLAQYVAAPGLFAGQENRAARIQCTQSLTALTSVLRSLSGGRDAFRRLKTWRESPLTRLMWACGMSELQSATLTVFIEDNHQRAVDMDKTSDLVLSPEDEGAYRFAIQLKESDADETAPRTREPPTPTPTKRPNLASKAPAEEITLKTLRTELPSSRTLTGDRRAPSRQRRVDVDVKGTKVSPEQIDAIVRVIRTQVHGLSGRRMESTIRTLASEWTQMVQAHEGIADEFAALEEQLMNAQTREDEAVQYAEQVAADLAVASRWCETLEAEQSTMNERIERAARDSAAAATARADAAERRMHELEEQLKRNSLPEMERVRDEAEEAARQALDMYRTERDEHMKTRETLAGEISTKRALIDQVGFSQARVEEIEAARASDREDVDRAREELRARSKAEGELRDRMAALQYEHDVALRKARDAVLQSEEKLTVMRRERDDALHKAQRGDEDLIEARANARANIFSVESLQTAANETKATLHDTQRELEDVKLQNSELLVQVKHATRELEETSLALNKLHDKLEELEAGSEDATRKRRAADDEVHDLRQFISDLEQKMKSMNMDREVAYQAADVARVENAKLNAKVLDLADDVIRLKASLEHSQAATRALLDDEAARLSRLAPAPAFEEYTTPSWLSDTSWQTVAPAT